MLQKKKTISFLLSATLLVGAVYGWSVHQRQLALATPADAVTALAVNMDADRASAAQMMRLLEVGHPLAWYQQAAEAGDETARYELAAMLVQGNQIQANPVQARRWLTSAPKLPAAQLLLGQMLLQGLGGPKDEQAGRALIEQAANAGDRQALYTLANWYRYADGKPLDLAKAVSLYQQAANRQYAPAMQDLALAYEFGDLGLEVDLNRASQLRNMAMHIAACKDSHNTLVKLF